MFKKIKKNLEINHYKYHISTFIKTIYDYLVYNINGTYVDCTFGGGGHTYIILNKISKIGKIYAFDFDKKSIENNIIIDKRLKLFNKNFINVQKILNNNKIYNISGAILDLGISSYQLDKSNKGLSIKKDCNLDMRMSNIYKINAKFIINKFKEKEIKKIFKKYGELNNCKEIARNIIKSRKIKKINTTYELINIIKNVTPNKKKFKFLARIFQSLRIFINNEIINLKKVIPKLIHMLDKNGRIIVISYHSLEDRIIKKFVKKYNNKKNKKNKLIFLKKKLYLPSKKDIKYNPRCKSGKLRIIKKT